MEHHQEMGPRGPKIELKSSGAVWLWEEDGALADTYKFSSTADFAAYCTKHGLSVTSFDNPEVLPFTFWEGVAKKKIASQLGSVVEFKRPSVGTPDGPRYRLIVGNFVFRVEDRLTGRPRYGRAYGPNLPDPWRCFAQWCETHGLSKADFEGGDVAPPWVWDDVRPQSEAVTVPAFMLMVKKDTVHVTATEPGSLVLSLRTFFDASDGKDPWQAFGEWVQHVGYCRKDFGNPEIAPEWVWGVDEAAVEQSTDGGETQGVGLYYKAALVDALSPYIAVFTSKALFRSAEDALNAAKAVVGYLVSLGAKASWEAGQDAWCKAIGGAFWHEETGAIDANKVHADRVVPISIEYEGETVAPQQPQSAPEEPKKYQAAVSNGKGHRIVTFKAAFDTLEDASAASKAMVKWVRLTRNNAPAEELTAAIVAASYSFCAAGATFTEAELTALFAWQGDLVSMAYVYDAQRMVPYPAEGIQNHNFAARTQYQAILLNGAGKLISEFASLMPSMQEAMDIAQKAAKDGEVPAIRVWRPDEMGVLTTSTQPPADGIYRDVKVQVYCSAWLTGTVTLKAANAKDFQKKMAELGVSALENVELRGQEDVSIEPNGDVNKVYLLETDRYDFNEDLNKVEKPV